MKKIIMFLFSLLLVLCITGCTKEIDKEMIKEELHSYVDEIEKPENIIQIMEYIYQYIDKKVDNLNKKDYENEVENIKKQLNEMVLTKEKGDEIRTDAANYQGNLPVSSIKDNDSCICLGIYNGAVVIFEEIPQDTIMVRTIFDFPFEFGSAFHMLVYYDHTFYQFEYTQEAQILIDNNILTIDDVAVIFKTFRFYLDNYLEYLNKIIHFSKKNNTI